MKLEKARNAVLGVAGGVVVTLALFLLIPLMNRSVYKRPETKRSTQVHWMKLHHKAKPSKTTPKKGKRPDKPKAPSPPKPLLPKPKFTRPAPPKARIGAPGGPLRLDLSDLGGFAPGGIPLYVPQEPQESREASGEPEAEKPLESRQSLYLPHELDSPPRALKHPTPLYPSWERRRGIEGLALLRFIVDERGKPHDIQVVDWEGSRAFGDTAKRALLRWTFSPGRRGGKDVSVRCQLRFYFREED